MLLPGDIFRIKVGLRPKSGMMSYRTILRCLYSAVLHHHPKIRGELRRPSTIACRFSTTAARTLAAAVAALSVLPHRVSSGLARNLSRGGATAKLRADIRSVVVQGPLPSTY